MSRRVGACSNDPVADEIASQALVDGATALGACLSGFFASAAINDGVLLSPLTILVGGVGVGGRAFDGRWRQPGSGVKRPRGFTEADTIPRAARVAVPCGIAAAAIACAYQTGTSMSSVVRPALALAKKAGVDGRRLALERIRQQGGHALKDPLFARPLLLLGGPSEGGVMSVEDLAPRSDLDVALVSREAEGATYHEASWTDQAVAAEALSLTRVVIAVDVNGGFAGVAYQVIEGPPLEGLQVIAPIGATPVMRGVTRLRPGSALPMAVPLALIAHGSAVDSIGAEPGASRVGVHPSLLLRRSSATRVVERVL